LDGLVGPQLSLTRHTRTWRDLIGEKRRIATVHALLKQSGELCATANTCSHLGGPLGNGTRDGDAIVCPWHGSRFDLCSGAALEGLAVFTNRYEVRTNEGKIEVRAATER
jgi:nitrite reductase/ring-hydroxylating ferredoxin subunit